MTWIEYLLQAAQKSKWNLELWVRMTEELTSFQRVFLELALEKETTPWEMTVGMSEPTRSIHLQAVLQELKKE